MTPFEFLRLSRRYITVVAMLVAFFSATLVAPNMAYSASDAEGEEIALSLATLLRSARAVISKNQKHINDPSVGDKGLSAEVVVAAAKANYMKATGVDLDSVDMSGLQGELLQAELKAIAEVMNDAQASINQEGVGLKGFLPAVFARLVTERLDRKSVV